MGNPNYRRPSERVVPTPQRAVTPAQPPPVARCTNTTACRVENPHPAKIFNVGDRDLPAIIKSRHDRLRRNLADGDYQSARNARNSLEAFYTVHGPADGSALLSLPPVPRRCKKACGVKNFHLDKIYEVASNDMPRIIPDKIKYLQTALDRGNYGSARHLRESLVQFYTFHGPDDGSALAAIPAIPKMCEDELCPCKSEHADKAYQESSRDLPVEMKAKVACTYKAYYRYENWKDMEEQKELNAFWAIHR